MALDYAFVTGRFALVRGDRTGDPDLDPDTVYCDQGTVTFTPVSSTFRVSDADPEPLTIVAAPVAATIGTDGRLELNGSDGVWLLDLGSGQLNPRVLRTSAAYTVTFTNVRAAGTSVTIDPFGFHPVAGEDNDLTELAPLPVIASVPITRGPKGDKGDPGPGIVSAVVNADRELVLTLEGGAEVNVGPIELLDNSVMVAQNTDGTVSLTVSGDSFDLVDNGDGTGTLTLAGTTVVLGQSPDDLDAAARTVSFEALAVPQVYGHRAADALMPENTMEAIDYIATAGKGQIVLETDVAELRDGSLWLFHDPTVDRTTDGTGNVVDYDAISVARLNIDTTVVTTATTNAVWPAMKPVSLEALLRRWGNRLLLCLEPKSEPTPFDLVNKICEALIRHKIHPDTVRINCATTTQAQTAQSYGYLSVLGLPNYTQDWAAIAAAGVDTVALVTAPTAPQAAAVHAAGLKLLVYYPYSRDKVAEWVALGVDAVTTHDPVWMRGGIVPATSDNWDAKVPSPGDVTMLNGTQQDHQPAFVGTDERELIANTYYRLGRVSPTPSSTVTVDIDVTYKSGITGAGQDFRMFLSDTDAPYAGSATSSGYIGLFYPFNGIQRTYVMTKGGATTQLQTATRTAWAADVTRHFRLQITPTSVVFTETTNSWTLTDTTSNATLHRPAGGWFLYLASAGNGVFRIKNVAVS